MTVLDRLRTVPGRVDARLGPLRSTVAYRAYSRYNIVRGRVLAGGIAYLAFFSIFPALAVGFTVFALVLGNREDLQVQVVEYLNSTFGSTVISYHEGQTGLVSIDQLVQPSVLTATGLIGLVTLVFAGLGWIGALRAGIQAVFAAREQTNFVVLKLFDLVLLAAAGLAVLTSVVVSVAVNVASGQVVGMLGIERGSVAQWSVNILGQLVLVLVDVGIFLLLFHRLSGVRVPWVDLAGGALIAAIGFSALKLFASELLKSTSSNRFLAASSILVGLLVWMNVLARLILVSAAWSATVASDRGHLHTPDPVTFTGVGAAPDDPAPPETARPGTGERRRSGVGPALLITGFVAGAVASRVMRRGRGRRQPPE